MVTFLLVAVLALVLLTLVSFWLLLYQVIRQQGRLLLRLDDLEAHLLDGKSRETAVGTDRKRLPGERPLSESRLLRAGLAAGTPAPHFSLPDIHGGTVSLKDYRGSRVLLVFSDPHCGPCDQLAPDLVRMHRRDRDENLTLLMVGRGDAEENLRKAKEHGIQFPVVLQKQWEISREYGIFATPVAFLIDEDGVTARDVAQGRDEILALVRTATPSGKERANGPLV